MIKMQKCNTKGIEGNEDFWLCDSEFEKKLATKTQKQKENDNDKNETIIAHTTWQDQYHY